MKIKVCGNKYNIKEVLSLQPDYMGFILYDKSPRFLDTTELTEIFKNNFQNTKTVAVSVNKDIAELTEILRKFPFKAVQLHGHEDADYCRQLKNLCPAIELIKAIQVSDTKIIESDKYLSIVDYLLLDTASEKFGGSGKSFDWAVLAGITINKPFFLAGGLSPANIEEALAIKNENLYALDLNSGFEDSAGLKNIENLRKVFNKVKL